MTAAAETFSTRTIDFHAHAILPSYVDALRVLKKFMMLANGTLEKFPNNSTCR